MKNKTKQNLSYHSSVAEYRIQQNIFYVNNEKTVFALHSQSLYYMNKYIHMAVI